MAGHDHLVGRCPAIDDAKPNDPKTRGAISSILAVMERRFQNTGKGTLGEVRDIIGRARLLKPYGEGDLIGPDLSAGDLKDFDDGPCIKD